VPFVSRIRLDDADIAKALPAGGIGAAAIYTDHVKPVLFLAKYPKDGVARYQRAICNLAGKALA